jgi:hypothetical protein
MGWHVLPRVGGEFSADPAYSSSAELQLGQLPRLSQRRHHLGPRSEYNLTRHYCAGCNWGGLFLSRAIIVHDGALAPEVSLSA